MKQNTDMRALVSARFDGDIALLRTIRADDGLATEAKRAATLRERNQMRMKLLGSAIRVTGGILPKVSESMEKLEAQVDVAKPLEAFVFSDADINAFVSEGRSRFLVGLSSTAVSILTADELEFVIGHELGHALFGHTEVAAGFLCESGRVTGDQGRLLRRWQRAAEISADRAGLLCCNSLEIASTAMIKTLAGLRFEGRSFNPDHLDDQWESLLGEILDEGDHDMWESSHPLPPVRVKAMASFWRQHQGGAESSSDVEVHKLLSVMDHRDRGPERQQQEGGMLVRFLLWGGLFVGTADGPLPDVVKRRLDALTVPGVDLDAILAEGGDVATKALAAFQEARENRRARLRAKELSALMKQLVAFAALDDHFSDHERARLGKLAEVLGLRPEVVDLLIQQHDSEA